MDRKQREELAERCIRMAEMLVGSRSTTADAWPSKVKKGGLRAAMGLKTDEPLEEQTSPSAVVKFFQSADKEGRGMVMFAVNSNKSSGFWKKVAAGIGKGKKSSVHTASLASALENVIESSPDARPSVIVDAANVALSYYVDVPGSEWTEMHDELDPLVRKGEAIVKKAVSQLRALEGQMQKVYKKYD